MRIILSILLLVISFFIGVPHVQAQILHPQATAAVDVSASVGEFYLSISGYVSPYASVVLLVDGVFIRATVADAGGNFSISQVLIKQGFSGFCLYAVDFKRIGESTTCFEFPPAESSIEMHNIFLPPTLGLQRSQIAAGSPAVAFGYTMPGAKVTLRLSNGQVLTTIADGTGYYEFQIENLPAGTYKLQALANYEGQDSLSPTKEIELKALSWWEQFLAFLKSLWNKLMDLVTRTSFGPLWIGLPLLLLIVFLILKLWPERFTFIYQSKLSKLFTSLHEPKKLHHAWFVGY